VTVEEALEEAVKPFVWLDKLAQYFPIFLSNPQRCTRGSRPYSLPFDSKKGWLEEVVFDDLDKEFIRKIK
jgi:hypothetical protein